MLLDPIESDFQYQRFLEGLHGTITFWSQQGSMSSWVVFFEKVVKKLFSTVASHAVNNAISPNAQASARLKAFAWSTGSIAQTGGFQGHHRFIGSTTQSVRDRNRL
jgi:hypothetical protein